MGVADFKVGVGSEEENRVHLAALGRLAHESLRVRMLGSAALDLAWLAAGRLNATLMLSNLPWDVTAGLLLVREAGGIVFDYDGSPHDAGSRYTLAAVPSLVEPVRRIVRRRCEGSATSWSSALQRSRATRPTAASGSDRGVRAVAAADDHDRTGTDRPEVHLHAGGQGFWVARLAATLGAEVRLCCALGGEPGRVLKV